MSTWANLSVQDSSSPLMEQLILIMTTMLVGYLMVTLFFNNYINRYLLHGQTIEIIWTFLPTIVLLFIALPSLRLLYLLDEINEPAITIKAIGHTFNWKW